MTGFSAVDYAVLLLYLVGITVFGTLFRRSQRTVKDYFLGAKNISWIVISLDCRDRNQHAHADRNAGPCLLHVREARTGRKSHVSADRVRFIIPRILISVLLRISRAN
jgi:hypothetical protein